MISRFHQEPSMGHSVVEGIKARLQKYPTARYESGETWIRVVPALSDGFIVQLRAGLNTYEVSFEGWHEDFGSEEEALNCFAFGLSTKCRLKVWSFASFDYKWTVEHNQDGAWLEDSTVGVLAVPFCKRRFRYLQNNTILGSGLDRH
jgi:hypothetical protein